MLNHHQGSHDDSLDMASSPKSTWDQTMAWCRQVRSHYLNQCWARPLCGHMASLTNARLTDFNRPRSTALTHLPLVPHLCVSESVSIGSDNGLSPFRRQVTIWTNAGILLIGTLGTNFSEIWIKIQNFSFTKIYFKMSSAKMAAILSWGRWVNWLA